MPTAHVNGVDLEYDTSGDRAGRPLLLVAGLGLQLIAWPTGFVDRLHRHGFFVIRFDNRDCGLSTQPEGQPDLMAVLGGDRSTVTYSIEDMAEDAAQLLDHLGTGPVHVAGTSMGGMITQALTIGHPHLVASACSIMSTTGNPQVGAPMPAATDALLRPTGPTRQEAIDRAVAISRAIGSPAYPADEDQLRELAGAAYDRAYRPEGLLRQLGAIFSTRDRTEDLGRVRTPFLVIHGEEDPLISLSGGQATADAVPGARLLTLPGMGHDLPPQLWDTITDGIAANTQPA